MTCPNTHDNLVLVYYLRLSDTYNTRRNVAVEASSARLGPVQGPSVIEVNALHVIVFLEQAILSQGAWIASNRVSTRHYFNL